MSSLAITGPSVPVSRPQTWFAAKIGVETRLGSAVEDRPDSVDVFPGQPCAVKIGYGWVVNRSVSSQRVLHCPRALGRQAVHAGHDGASWVGGADRVGDRGGPHVGLFARRGAHAVALVTQIPSGDCSMVPEFSDEVPHESKLPRQWPSDQCRTFSRSSAGGTYRRPLIHPVIRPTIHWRLFFSSRLRKSAKRCIISADIPDCPQASSGSGSSPNLHSAGLPISFQSWWIGWKSGQTRAHAGRLEVFAVLRRSAGQDRGQRLPAASPATYLCLRARPSSCSPPQILLGE